MAKKKTFEEYTKEALYEIEKTEAALKQAKLEKEQAEHRIQRSLNYMDTQKKEKTKGTNPSVDSERSSHRSNL